MYEIIAGLVGALIGAGVVFSGEYWKQMIDFRAAARLVRHEMLMNSIALDRSVQKGIASRKATRPAIEVWNVSQLKLVPLLGESILRSVAGHYRALMLLCDTALANYDSWDAAGALDNKMKEQVERTLASMQKLAAGFRGDAEALGNILERRRIELFVRALTAKPIDMGRCAGQQTQADGMTV